MEEEERGRAKSKRCRDGKSGEMEQEGKSRIRPMSHRKRQPTSLAPQDRKSGKLRMPEVRKICGDRQARSLSLHAWGGCRAKVKYMGRHG